MEVAGPIPTAAPTEAVLWQTYGPRIYRYLLRLTGQRQTAEDLTQETFLRVIRDRRRSGRPPEHEGAWIFRIATNLARDHARRRRLIAWIPFRLGAHDPVGADPGEAVTAQELVDRVLRTLPPETAAMLLLKDGEGFSTREIAAMTGREYEAVRKRLARARLQFRAQYEHLKGGDR